MTPNDIDRLRRLANKAKSELWFNNFIESLAEFSIRELSIFHIAAKPSAAYIAAASPSVVLELIARIEELEKALANVKTAIEHQPVSAVADTLWMPDEIFRGGTIHDYIDHVLSKRGDQS